MLIFPKINKTIMLKRNKNIFLIFWARQGLTLVLRILMKMRNQGYVVLYKLVCLKMLMFFIFWKFCIFFDIFGLVEDLCHTTRTVGQTLKKGKENFFWYLKMSVTRCERPDRHNKEKENIFIFLIFLFFAIFIIFKYICFFCFFL